MKQRRRRTSHGTREENAGMTLLFCVLKTCAVTLSSAALFAVISALILARTPDPVTGVGVAAWVSLGLSCIVGGIAARAFDCERAETVALGSGGMLACVLLIAALALGGVKSPLYTAIGYAAAVLTQYLSAKAAKKLLGAKKRRRRAYSG